jgi:hypothetical protein
MPIIQALRRWKQMVREFEVSPGKFSETLSQKQNKNKRARV